MKKQLTLTLLASIALLSACQSTPVASTQAPIVYGQKPADYHIEANQDCPIISQLTREYCERLMVTSDMVVRWSDENSSGTPRILLILNDKGVSSYNTLSQQGLPPALNIGKHTFVPKANTGITQGFLTLDNLPDGWSESCTARLFAK